MSLGCVLLTGGNAAGKTTLLQAAQARLVARGVIKPEWVIFADLNKDFKAKGKKAAPDQFHAVMRRWVDPTHRVILIEGVRIYSAVLRCLTYGPAVYGVHRGLRAGLLLRENAVGAAHIRARCEKRGKPYNAELWDAGKRVTNLLSGRYVNAFEALKTEHPEAALLETQHFWIDKDYEELGQVDAWLDAAVDGPW